MAQHNSMHYKITNQVRIRIGIPYELEQKYKLGGLTHVDRIYQDLYPADMYRLRDLEDNGVYVVISYAQWEDRYVPKIKSIQIIDFDWRDWRGTPKVLAQRTIKYKSPVKYVINWCMREVGNIIERCKHGTIN